MPPPSWIESAIHFVRDVEKLAEVAEKTARAGEKAIDAVEATGKKASDVVSRGAKIGAKMSTKMGRRSHVPAFYALRLAQLANVLTQRTGRMVTSADALEIVITIAEKGCGLRR